MIFTYRFVFFISLTLNFSSAEEGEKILKRVRRIIGGTPIKDGDYPWLAYISANPVSSRGIFNSGANDLYYIYCGGSVINDRWILSAAHCFDNIAEISNVNLLDPLIWEVKLAAVDIQETMWDRIRSVFFRQNRSVWKVGVEKIIQHPDYSRARWENDIALVRLSRSVPAGGGHPRIQKINLPDSNDLSFPADKTMCKTKGWGCQGKGSPATSVAREVDIPVHDSQDCGSVFDIKKTICAGYFSKNKGVCEGDSGGPLVCKKDGKWILVGVTSTAQINDPGNYPASFTRVSSYVDWIKGVI